MVILRRFGASPQYFNPSSPRFHIRGICTCTQYSAARSIRAVFIRKLVLLSATADDDDRCRNGGDRKEGVLDGGCPAMARGRFNRSSMMRKENKVVEHTTIKNSFVTRPPASAERRRISAVTSSRNASAAARLSCTTASGV